MNPPKNTAVETSKAVLEKIIIDLLLEKAMKEALEEVAWLALPIINPIFTFVMKFCAKFLYKKTALEAAFMIIKKQTGQQKTRYEAEIKKLDQAIKEGKTDEEINEQREKAKERLRKLINFNAG